MSPIAAHQGSFVAKTMGFAMMGADQHGLLCPRPGAGQSEVTRFGARTAFNLKRDRIDANLTGILAIPLG